MVSFCLQLADHFCNSIGILQQNAASGSFLGMEKSGTVTKEPAGTSEGNLLASRHFSAMLNENSRLGNVINT